MAQLRIIDMVYSETSRRRNIPPLQSEINGRRLIGQRGGDLVYDKNHDGH
jgi:hypothetical protein